MAKALDYHHPITQRRIKAVQADCCEILNPPELDSNFVKNDIQIFLLHLTIQFGLYKTKFLGNTQTLLLFSPTCHTAPASH